MVLETACDYLVTALMESVEYCASIGWALIDLHALGESRRLLLVPHRHYRIDPRCSKRGIEQAKKTTADRTPITARKFLGLYALISNSILRMNRTIISATKIPAHPQEEHVVAQLGRAMNRSSSFLD
jgi:hypothetical protein